MDETRRNSMKLDIEAVRLSENDHDQLTESYKQVSEFSSNDKSTVQPAANMTREKSDNVEDGADEKMLAVDDKEQLARKDEVKFIASDRSNGEAKIDMGSIEKSFTGMTKEELMKYANDPFWQRLRWIFFILFWLLWAAMLAGAIWIILKAPKCQVAEPLSWYKEGPLVVMPRNTDIKIVPPVIEKLQAIDAKGVIYNLPADKTYLLDQKEVQDYIKGVVDNFKNTTIKVIFDLTPNYVTTDNKLYTLAGTNETYRNAFVWKETARLPNNWLSKVPNLKTNGSAWQLATQANNYVLSQFGENNIDLQMNEPIVKDMLKDVLRKMVRMGVSGFRLANAKHYIIDKDTPNDASISDNRGAVHTEYRFWTHSGTTNRPGIGELLHEFWNVVNNETNGDGFLSVADYIESPEVFKRNDLPEFGFDLPILVNLTTTLQMPNDSSSVAKKLYTQLSNAFKNSEKHSVWMQWPYEKLAANNAKIGTSEYNIFLFLLPGVPVGSINDFTGFGNATIEEIKKLEAFRKTPSYQHGSFEVYSGLNDTVIAYTRLKSGHPGYFVVYNPTDLNVIADFSAVKSLPELLTVELTSKPSDKNVVSTKVPTNAIPLQANSAIVFTYAKSNA